MFSSMIQMESSLLEELHHASKSGDTDRMKQLLRRGVIVSSKSAQHAFIQQAINNGDHELLKMLLQSGIPLLTDPVTITEVLHNAAEDGDTELLALLLDHGARSQVNYIIPGVKDTALHLAVRGKHLDAVLLLLSHCADTRALTSTRRCFYRDDAFEFVIDDYVTALHLVAESGNFDIAKALLGKEGDINAMTSHGYTALHLAVLENHNDIVRLLLRAGSRVSLLTDFGESVVDIATRRGNMKALQTLDAHMTTMVLVSSEDAHDEEKEEERLWVIKYLKRISKRKLNVEERSVKLRRVTTEEDTNDQAVRTESGSIHETGNKSTGTLITGKGAKKQATSYKAKQGRGIIDGNVTCIQTATTLLSDKREGGNVTGGSVVHTLGKDIEVYEESLAWNLTREDEDQVSIVVSTADRKAESSSTETNSSMNDTLNTSWHLLEARPIIDGSVNSRPHRSRTGSVNQYSLGMDDSPMSKASPMGGGPFWKSANFESQDQYHNNPASSLESLIPFADEHVDELESPNIRYPEKTDDDVFREFSDVQEFSSGRAQIGHIEARWTHAGDIEMVIIEGDTVSPLDGKGDNYESMPECFDTNSTKQVVVSDPRSSESSDSESLYFDALSILAETDSLGSISQDEEHTVSNVNFDDGVDEEYLNDRTLRAAIVLMETRYSDDSDDDTSDTTLSDNEESRQSAIRYSTTTEVPSMELVSGQEVRISMHSTLRDQMEEGTANQKVVQTTHVTTIEQRQRLMVQGTPVTRYTVGRQAEARHRRTFQDVTVKVTAKVAHDEALSQATRYSHDMKEAAQNKAKLEGIRITGDLELLDIERDINNEKYRVEATEHTLSGQSSNVGNVHGRLQFQEKAISQLANAPGNKLYQAQTDRSLGKLQGSINRNIEDANVTQGLILLKAEEDTNLEVYRMPGKSVAQTSIPPSEAKTMRGEQSSGRVESKAEIQRGPQIDDTPSTQEQDAALNKSSLEGVVISGGLVLLKVESDPNLEVYRVPLRQKKRVSFAEGTHEETDSEASPTVEEDSELEEEHALIYQNQQDAQDRHRFGDQHQLESSSTQPRSISIQAPIETQNEYQFKEQSHSQHGRSADVTHPHNQDLLVPVQEGDREHGAGDCALHQVESSERKATPNESELDDRDHVQIAQIVSQFNAQHEQKAIQIRQAFEKEPASKEDNSQHGKECVNLIQMNTSVESQNPAEDRLLLSDATHLRSPGDQQIKEELQIVKETVPLIKKKSKSKEKDKRKTKKKKANRDVDDPALFGQEVIREVILPEEIADMAKYEGSSSRNAQFTNGIQLQEQYISDQKNRIEEHSKSDDLVLSKSELQHVPQHENEIDYIEIVSPHTKDTLEKQKGKRTAKDLLLLKKKEHETQLELAGETEVKHRFDGPVQIQLEAVNATEFENLLQIQQRFQDENYSKEYRDRSCNIQQNISIANKSQVAVDQEIKPEKGEVTGPLIVQCIELDVQLEEQSRSSSGECESVVLTAAKSDLAEDQEIESSNYIDVIDISETVIVVADTENYANLHLAKSAKTDNQIIHDHEKTITDIISTTDVLHHEDKPHEAPPEKLAIDIDSIRFIDDSYGDISIRRSSTGLVEDCSLKYIRGAEDAVLLGEKDVTTIYFAQTSKVDSVRLPKNDDEQVKEQVSSAHASPNLEQELSVPLAPDGVAPVKMKKKKKKKKKLMKSTDQKIKDQVSVSGALDQESQGQHSERQHIHIIDPLGTVDTSELKSTVMLQATTVPTSTTGEGTTPQVKSITVDRKNEKPKLAKKLDVHTKTTQEMSKQEYTTKSPNSEEQDKSTHLNIREKIKFEQQKSPSDEKEDEIPTESKPDNMNTVEAVLSYMNTKYDDGSEDYLEEIPCTKQTSTCEPSTGLSTFEIPAMNAFSSKSTHIDTLLLDASVSRHPEDTDQDNEDTDQDNYEAVPSNHTTAMTSDVERMGPISTNNKEGNQQASLSSEQLPIPSEREVTELFDQPCMHEPDPATRERHDEPALSIDPEHETSVTIALGPDDMTLVKTKKKKKKKPDRPSRKTHSTADVPKEPVQTEQGSINLGRGDLHDSIYSVESANLILASNEHEEDKQKQLDPKKDGFPINSAKQGIPDSQASPSIRISMTPTTTNVVKVKQGKETSAKGQLVPEISSSRDGIQGRIGQEVQKIPTTISRQYQQTKIIPNIYSHDTDGHSKYEDIGFDISTSSSSKSEDSSKRKQPKEHLSNRERITHPDVSEVVLSPEEYIMDAVADTDQSEIVAKIDQIIIKSLSNIIPKYKSQWCSDEEESEDSRDSVHLTARHSSSYLSRVGFSGKSTEIDSLIPHADVNTTHMQYDQTTGLQLMQAESESEKGLANLPQLDISMPQRKQDIQMARAGQQIEQQNDSHSSLSSANDQEVPACTSEASLNQTYGMKAHPQQSDAARESMIRVTNLDDYMSPHSTWYKPPESESVNLDLIGDASTITIPISKADTIRRAIAANEQIINSSLTSDNENYTKVRPILPVSPEIKLTDKGTHSKSSEAIIQVNAQTRQLEKNIQTQTQEQEHIMRYPIQSLGRRVEEQNVEEQIKFQQTFHEQVLPNKENNELDLNFQKGQQETNLSISSRTMDARIQISTLNPHQCELHNDGDAQSPKEETMTELQMTTNEGGQNPVEKKKSKSKSKDKDEAKKKSKKLKKKTAEKESLGFISSDQRSVHQVAIAGQGAQGTGTNEQAMPTEYGDSILAPAVPGIADEAILAGQGEHVPQTNFNISGNIGISNDQLNKGDISPGGMVVTSTPENEQNQPQTNQPHPRQGSGSRTSQANYTYLESTPPSRSSSSFLPSQSKLRKVSTPESDPIDAIGKENQGFNLNRSNMVTPASPPITTFMPPTHPQARARRTPQDDESFTSPRESAKKAKPMTIPDVYVLLKFDKGSLSNLGVIKKSDSTEPGIAHGAMDVNTDGRALRVSQNTSFQTDANFVDASAASHFDLNDSMITKSMDELDVQQVPVPHQQLPANQRGHHQLRRTQSGGALYNAGKGGWGASQRSSRSGSRDISKDVLKANQTFDAGEPIRSSSGSSGVHFKTVDQVSVYHSQTHVGSPNYRQVTRAAMPHGPVLRPRSKSRERTVPLLPSKQEGLYRTNMPGARVETRQHRSSEGQFKDIHFPTPNAQVIQQKPPKSPKWGTDTREKANYPSRSAAWGDSSNAQTDYTIPKSNAQTDYIIPKTHAQTDYTIPKSHNRRQGYQQAVDQSNRSMSWVGIPAADIKITDQQVLVPESDVQMRGSSMVDVVRHPMKSSSWVNVEASDQYHESPIQRIDRKQTTRSVGDLQITEQSTTMPSLWINARTPDQQGQANRFTQSDEQLDTTPSVTSAQPTSYRMKTPSWMHEKRTVYQEHELDYNSDSRSHLRETTHVRGKPAVPEQQINQGPTGVAALFTHGSMRHRQRHRQSPPRLPANQALVQQQQQQYQQQYQQQQHQQQQYQQQQYQQQQYQQQYQQQQYQQQYQQQQFRDQSFDPNQRRRDRIPSAPSGTAQHYHPLVSPSGTSSNRISDPTGLGGTLDQSIDTEIW